MVNNALTLNIYGIYYFNMVKEVLKEENLQWKTADIDEFDRKIVNILNKDAYKTLREISSEIGLSINAVKNRISHLRETGAIMKVVAIPDQRFFGFPFGSHVYVKLQYTNKKMVDEFVSYLKNHKRIIVFISMVGDYDLYFVVMVKDTIDLAEQTSEIRNKFAPVISDWKEMLVSKIIKYEEYSF